MFAMWNRFEVCSWLEFRTGRWPNQSLRALPKEAVEIAHVQNNWCPCSNNVWCNVNIQCLERYQTNDNLM
ncbi:hypothetical protein N7537_003241 [Penicillium hordei]|uniref:Uncharacterized protein n=1 Tax=Penicillium hordei TaxID=40994 RepID=A0AAD6H9M3_9EURO|nr:uncharacterized protein N7537_003241 [Penicillium hordei]KAJ5618127.1 hypothetical protein N7537_003241 [Penicillium hordei]